jgi:hydroxymethylpyrimidine pyrophosphatase-like HAD family hydrolase
MFQYILHRFGISLADSVAVGDGENDICMVKMAGTGISFNSITSAVDEVADYTFRDQSLKPVLGVAR